MPQPPGSVPRANQRMDYLKDSSPRRHRRLGGLALAVALVGVTLVASPTPGGATSHAKVTVPHLVGLRHRTVAAELNHLGLGFHATGLGAINGTWKTVTAQTPKAGVKVAWHSVVQLVVTGGHNPKNAHLPRKVPNVVGLSRPQVFGAMKRAGLYFETIGPGAASGTWVSVQSVSPKPGTWVAWHATVKVHVLIVNPRGPRPLPDLVGMSRVAVYNLMRTLKLYFRTVGPGASNGTWQQVVGQHPYAGTYVKWHSTVVLTVSTAAPPATTVPTGNSSNSRVGTATWYSYIPGYCASPFLEKGTVVKVKDLSNGHEITCVVTDHEAAGGTRVVDLSETQFAKLAPLSVGVVRVRITW